MLGRVGWLWRGRSSWLLGDSSEMLEISAR
jgi:hypothetical protein